MRCILIFALLPLLNANALDLPLNPAEKQVIEQIVELEKIEVALAATPGWSARSTAETLIKLGVPKDQIAAVTIHDTKNDRVAVTITHNQSGQILGITGNGPWLSNDTLKLLSSLPELRILRMDHNGYLRQDPRSALYDGSGFAAFMDSKLAEIKIGLSFSDKGMEQCAKIKTLKTFHVAHSQATEAGIAFFAGHPGLTNFSIGEMASNRVSEKALGAIAKIPNLTHVGFKECYVTYDGGFALLAPAKGRLIEIDLSMSIASAGDLAKLQADHPDARIITLPPEEIVKRHKFIAANLAKQAPPELAAPLKAALEKIK